MSSLLPPPATCTGSCIVPAASCPFLPCPATVSPHARTHQLGCGRLVPARPRAGSICGWSRAVGWAWELSLRGAGAHAPRGQEMCSSAAHPGRGHPPGHSGEVSGGCSDAESQQGGLVPLGWGWRQARAGAAGSRTRLPGWAAGACFGGGPGRGREVGLGVGGKRFAMGGGAAVGRPRPAVACPVQAARWHPARLAPRGPLGRCLGPGGSLQEHQGPVLVLGPGGKEYTRGSESRLRGVSDSVSPLAVLVPGFSLILHGSSTGSCDL